jgi:glycosyltransferase involved in cell wall biosynthesis
MKKWHVQQLGSREAYLYPRLLHDLGLLETFSTDIWVANSGNFFCPGSLNRLKNRYHPSLKDIPIYSKNLRSILRMIKPYDNNKYDNWVKEGSLFSEWSWKNISKHDIDNDSITFGYSMSSLESLTLSKKEGALAILGQIDPGLYWYDTLQEEYLEWLGYFPKDINPTDVFKERIQAEWDIADKIIVNSVHSKNSLIQYGVDFSKIEVLPLPVNYKPSRLSKQLPKKNETIKVIFVGNISLAKGFQYFAEAQKKLGSKYEFIAIGDLHLPEELFTKYDWNINLTGRVNKNQLIDYYREASLLIFPTLSDGFGQVQLEALSFGIPVIATENCASVVTSGLDGEVIPIKNTQAIIEAILKITSSEFVYEQYSVNALKKIDYYSYDKIKSAFNKFTNIL